jgi:hypothetical protein
MHHLPHKVLIRAFKNQLTLFCGPIRQPANLRISKGSTQNDEFMEAVQRLLRCRGGQPDGVASDEAHVRAALFLANFRTR